MRLIWCTIWVLSALLVAASLDTTPDPPAVDPFKMAVKVPSPGEHADGLARELSGVHVTTLLTPFRTLGSVFSEECEPHHPGEFIVQSGYAADPSPPAGA